MSDPTDPTSLQTDVLTLIAEEIVADVRQRTSRLGLSDPAVAGSVLVHALARLSADAIGPVPAPFRSVAASATAEAVAGPLAVAMGVFLSRTGATA